MQKLFNNKIFQVVYGIFRTIVVSLLVMYLAFIVIQRLTNNSSIFGYRVFTVATGSMEPVYMVNDVILVKDVDIDTLRVGDDVAYLGNSSVNRGLVITHRIVRIEPNEVGEVRYYLKGVNNEYEDPSISGSQIYGKVVGKVYIINFINHVVKNMYGFFFLVFCPLVLVIFLEIADTIIDIKVSKNELRLIDDSNDTKDITNDKSLKSVDGDDSEEVI